MAKRNFALARVMPSCSW